MISRSRAWALGAVGGAAAGVADGLHAGLGERVGVGVPGVVTLVVAGALLGAVIGGLVAGAMSVVAAGRRGSHRPVSAGAVTVLALRTALAWGGVGGWIAAAVGLVLGVAVVWWSERWGRTGGRALVLGGGLLMVLWALTGRPAPVMGRTPTREQPNVLVVSVGGMRPDRLGSWPIDTPTIDRMAVGGVAFDIAWAPSTETAVSARALMTGRSPWDEAAEGSLAATLLARGWSTAAFVGTVLLRQDGVLDEGFQVYDDEQGWVKGITWALPGRLWAAVRARAEGQERRADQVVDRALRWTAGRNGRWMCWVHLHDPSAPFEPPPPWDERYYRGSDPRSPTSQDLGREAPVHEDYRAALAGVTDPAWVEARYDGEVAWTDTQIARLLEGLDGQGWMGTTLVVVVGLHGEVLREGRVWFGRDGELVDAALRVPLVLTLPARLPNGDRIKTPVELADVAPTVLDLVGEADGLAGATGLSLRPTMEGSGRARSMARAVAGGSPRAAAVRVRGLMFVRDPGGTDRVVRTHEALTEVWTAEMLADRMSVAAGMDGTQRPPPTPEELAPWVERVEPRSAGWLGGGEPD